MYLSEDRKGKGLLVDFKLRPNLTLMTLEHYAHPLLDIQAEQAALKKAVGDYGIRSGRLDVEARLLSGGNQQKLALARILEADPQVIVLDEPNAVALETLAVLADRSGVQPSAIVRFAKLNGCNLIVMASHGRRGVQKLLLGSQTAEVLAHTTIPVLVVR